MLENWQIRENEEYKKQIKNRKFAELRNRSNIYFASSIWLKENKVISEEDFTCQSRPSGQSQARPGPSDRTVHHQV